MGVRRCVKLGAQNHPVFQKVTAQNMHSLAKTWILLILKEDTKGGKIIKMKKLKSNFKTGEVKCKKSNHLL